MSIWGSAWGSAWATGAWSAPAPVPRTQRPWNTTYSYADQIIKPASGGKIQLAGETAIAGQLAIDGASRVRAKTAIAQSIPSGSYTTIQYGTKDYDNLGEYDTSTYKLTFKKSGYYHVNAQILYTSVAWGAVASALLTVYINGSGVVNLCRMLGLDASVTNYRFLGGGTDIEVSAGDYMEIKTVHNRGSATALHNSASYNFFTCHRLS